MIVMYLFKLEGCDLRFYRNIKILIHMTTKEVLL